MASLTFAQVGEHRCDLSIGFTGGYTMNTMDFVPKIKQTQKGSPMIGFSSRYVCEKYFTTICAVELELLYNNLGWKEVIEDGSENTYKRDWHFLEMPILMQMGWGRERRGLKFLFEAGPQVGLYLSGKEQRPRPQDRLRYCCWSWLGILFPYWSYPSARSLLLWFG